MTENPNGSIDFCKNKLIYRFEKFNYEKHIEKRPRISEELGKIEDTILNPDAITAGPRTRKQRNFYKVLSYDDNGGIRYVTFWKIITFRESATLARIATCIYSSSPNYYVINSKEKIVWKKPNSQI